MAGYSIVSLGDMVKELGEGTVRPILSSFCCPLNKDVEFFIKSKSIEFEKQALSKTHLVYASYKQKNVLVGYFTLANKPIVVKQSSLNAEWKKRLRRFSQNLEVTKASFLAAPLIAQLAKNYVSDYNSLITGDELLELACETVRKAQSLVGGRFVYLECEDKDRLLEFYERNGFREFDKRSLDGDERELQDGEYLVQLIKYLK